MEEAHAPTGRPRGRLTLRQIEAFARVHDSGRLGDAAQALGVTVSAASLLIRQAEAELGAALFERTPQGLKPTALAQALIGTARQMLAAAQGLHETAQAWTAQHADAVVVAASPGIAAQLMPAVIARFMAQAGAPAGIPADTGQDTLTAAPADAPAPASTVGPWRIVLDDAAPDQLVAHVMDGRAEIGIGTLEQAAPDGLLAEALVRDRLGVICRHDHPLAAGEQVEWGGLQGVPLITVRPGHGIRTLLDEALVRTGVTVTLAFEVSLFATALALARQGLGVAVLPSFLLSFTHDPDLVARPLVHPEVPRDICVMRRADRALSAGAQAFLQTLRAQIGD